MNLGTAARALRRRGPWYITIKVLLSLFVLVYAANINVAPRVYHAETGGAVKVTNNLLAMDKGFSKAGSTISAAGTSCGSNVTFAGSPGTANTAITTNNIIFTIQVNTTTSTPTSTCFTVTLTITSSGGNPSSYSVFLATGSVPNAGQTIDCKFDIGASLPASPYSFKVTVQ